MTQAVGIFFYSKSTDRFLYLLRSDTKSPTWSIPGGKVEANESLYDAIHRECLEEIGFFTDGIKIIPIQKFTNNDFVYHTFFCKIDYEFIPTLNYEHTGYAWVGSGLYPKPLHSGLFSTIKIDIVKDKIDLLKNN
jgi:8-oxo-dGTP pyrophosphatase MutT (NUDIX family)